MDFNLKHIKALEFKQQFKTKDDCLRYLAEQKWKDGFICTKCSHDNFCPGKTPYSRRCTKCKKEESATANTLFHHCRIDLLEAFKMAHEVCSNPNISSYQISERFNIRQMTCWKFKKKITECLEQQVNS